MRSARFPSSLIDFPAYPDGEVAAVSRVFPAALEFPQRGCHIRLLDPRASRECSVESVGSRQDEIQ